MEPSGFGFRLLRGFWRSGHADGHYWLAWPWLGWLLPLASLVAGGAVGSIVGRGSLLTFATVCIVAIAFSSARLAVCFLVGVAAVTMRLFVAYAFFGGAIMIISALPRIVAVVLLPIVKRGRRASIAVAWSAMIVGGTALAGAVSLASTLVLASQLSPPRFVVWALPLAALVILVRLIVQLRIADSVELQRRLEPFLSSTPPKRLLEHVPEPVVVVVRAAVVVVPMSGLIHSAVQGVVVVAIVVGVQIARPRLHLARVRRIPLPLRIVCAVGVSVGVVMALLASPLYQREPEWTQLAASLAAMIVCLVFLSGVPAKRSSLVTPSVAALVIGLVTTVMVFDVARAQPQPEIPSTQWPWFLAQGKSRPRPQLFVYKIKDRGTPAFRNRNEKVGSILYETEVTIAPILEVYTFAGNRELKVDLGWNQVTARERYKRREPGPLELDYHIVLTAMANSYVYQRCSDVKVRYRPGGLAWQAPGVIPKDATHLDAVQVTCAFGASDYTQQVVFVFAKDPPPPLASATPICLAVGLLLALLSLWLDALPGIGTLKGMYEGLTGVDTITGEELAWWQRALGLLPGSLELLRELKPIVRAGREGADAVRHLDDVETSALKCDEGAGGCFAPDTIVLARGGRHTVISEIATGDRVRVAGEQGDREVAQVLRDRAPELTIVTISDGKRSAEIRCTPRHRIATLRGWVPAAELRARDVVVGWDASTPLLVVSVERSPTVSDVWNLHVTGDHCFFVSELGALVHNHCEARSQADLKPILEAEGFKPYTVDGRVIDEPAMKGGKPLGFGRKDSIVDQARALGYEVRGWYLDEIPTDKKEFLRFHDDNGIRRGGGKQIPREALEKLPDPVPRDFRERTRDLMRDRIRDQVYRDRRDVTYPDYGGTQTPSRNEVDLAYEVKTPREGESIREYLQNQDRIYPSRPGDHVGLRKPENTLIDQASGRLAATAREGDAIRHELIIDLRFNGQSRASALDDLQTLFREDPHYRGLETVYPRVRFFTREPNAAGELVDKLHESVAIKT